MAGKPVKIHPAALAEFKSALGWYFERSRAAALKLVEELDRTIQMVVESPARWPKGDHSTRKICLAALSFCNYLWGETDSNPKYWLLPTGIGDPVIGKNAYSKVGDSYAKNHIPLPGPEVLA